MSRKFWIAVAAVCLCPLAAPAQEYNIKIAKAGPGDQFQAKTDNLTEIEFKALDANGNVVVEKKEVKSHTLVFREVGLERGPGGHLTKLKRKYKKAQRTKDGDRRTLVFQGETVNIEKQDGAFSFKIDGGETVEGDDAKELHEEFNKGGMAKLFEAFLPKKTVAVNVPWKFDVAMLAKEFTKDGKLEIDGAKSTGVGKLTKAYKKNGKQFGVTELTITFPVTAIDHEGNKSPAKKSKLVLKLELDGCIDGSLDESRLKLAIDGEIRADINANGMDLSLEIAIHGTGEDHRTPVKK